MEKLLNEYREYLYTRESSNINSRIYTVGQFVLFLKEKGIENLNISLSIAEEYKVHLSTVKISDRYYHRGTINNKLAFLNGFYCYLQKKGIVIANPFIELKHIKVDDHLPKNILTEEEVATLFKDIELTSLNDIIFFLSWELLYSCGIRISELANLKIKDILFERGIIKIVDAKTKKERFIPVNDYCLNLIKIYQANIRPHIMSENELYLLPQSSGITTLRCFMNQRLIKLVGRTEINKKITTHSFRHSMATSLFKNGAGLREVQSLLGHARIKTTEIYTRVAKEDLKEVLKTMHPRESLFQDKK